MLTKGNQIDSDLYLKPEGNIGEQKTGNSAPQLNAELTGV
jgi:hypothetical protein